MLSYSLLGEMADGEANSQVRSYKFVVRLDYKLIHLSRPQLYTLNRLVLAVSVCFFLVLRYSLLGEAAGGEMHSRVRFV